MCTGSFSRHNYWYICHVHLKSENHTIHQFITNNLSRFQSGNKNERDAREEINNKLTRTGSCTMTFWVKKKAARSDPRRGSSNLSTFILQMVVKLPKRDKPNKSQELSLALSVPLLQWLTRSDWYSGCKWGNQGFRFHRGLGVIEAC